MKFNRLGFFEVAILKMLHLNMKDQISFEITPSDLAAKITVPGWVSAGGITHPMLRSSKNDQWYSINDQGQIVKADLELANVLDEIEFAKRQLCLVEVVR
jgi:hypothetical protein